MVADCGTAGTLTLTLTLTETRHFHLLCLSTKTSNETKRKTKTLTLALPPGACSLIAQSVLPVLALGVPSRCTVSCRGGTDVPFSPPLGYLQATLPNITLISTLTCPSIYPNVNPSHSRYALPHLEH